MDKWAMRTVLLCFLAFTGAGHAQFPREKTVIGRVEWVELPDLKLRFRARIDTGAQTTSLHATHVEEFQREGATWVKFRLRDRGGKDIEVSRKVESTAQVMSTTGTGSKRYVIREKLKLGKVVRELPVNLNDRTRMSYPILVGRNFLMGYFLVDVARSHVMGD